MAKKDIVMRIKDLYVGDNYCQLMIPHGERVVLLSKEGVILQKGFLKNVNKYLSDSRKSNMPYSNIPTHCMKFFDGKIFYSNEILNNNDIYLSFTDGSVSEYMTFKGDDGKTYYYAKQLYPRNRGGLELSDLSLRKELKDFYTREYVMDLFKKNDSDEVYLIRDDGVLLDGLTIPSEKELSESLDYDFHKELKCLNEIVENDKSNLGNYLKDSEILKRLNKLDNERDPFETAIDVLDGHVLFVVRVNGDDIKVTGYRIYYLSEDTYFVDFTRLRVNRVSYDDFKGKKFIFTTKSPKIRLKDNPDISKVEIERAKKFIKEKSSK